MTTRDKISQIYGYLVCLVTIIVFFISISLLVNSTLDYNFPEKTNNINYYQLDKTQDPQLTKEEQEKQRKEQIESVKFDALKGIINGSLLLVISAGLFVGHWRWLKKLAKD